MDPAMQEQLLQQLRDIHAPEAISWWPLAIGWWVLILLALAAVAGVAVFLYLRHKREAYRREALEIAKACFRQYEQDENTSSYLEQINQLLRRVMLKVSHDKTVAKASGSAWISVLNLHSIEPFSEEASDALSMQIYRPQPEADVHNLHHELIGWIRSHKRAPNA